MGSLFKKPKVNQIIQQAPPPPPVATIDTAIQDEEFSRKLRRRRGHAANMIGAGGAAQVALRQLLG